MVENRETRMAVRVICVWSWMALVVLCSMAWVGRLDVLEGLLTVGFTGVTCVVLTAGLMGDW